MYSNMYGAAKPIPMTCNPAQEAQRLQKAMKGLGTDEDSIILVLGRRPSHERAAIAKEFKAQYGKELTEVLKTEISGNFYKVCKNLCMLLAEYDAKVLYKSIKGIGTKEKTIIETLVSKNNHQITAIKEAYLRMYNKSLEQDIKGDTSGDFCNVLVAILQGLREEQTNPGTAEQDAHSLYQAGENRMGTNEDVFTRILCHRSYGQIKLIAEAYERQHGKHLEKAIKGETFGFYEQTLLAIVQYSTNPGLYFAKLFYEAMKGLGTNDSKLQRLCISQSEGNMNLVKQAFLQEYNTNLGDFIRGDTSGDYEKLLLILVGEK